MSQIHKKIEEILDNIYPIKEHMNPDQKHKQEIRREALSTRLETLEAMIVERERLPLYTHITVLDERNEDLAGALKRNTTADDLDFELIRTAINDTLRFHGDVKNAQGYKLKNCRPFKLLADALKEFDKLEGPPGKRNSLESAPLQIWYWRQAPEELKQLSEHGGDEDWVAVMRKSWIESEHGQIPYFLETKPFAVCDYSQHEYGDYIVIISAHA